MKDILTDRQLAAEIMYDLEQMKNEAAENEKRRRAGQSSPAGSFAAPSPRMMPPGAPSSIAHAHRRCSSRVPTWVGARSSGATPRLSSSATPRLSMTPAKNLRKDMFTPRPSATTSEAGGSGNKGATPFSVPRLRVGRSSGVSLGLTPHRTVSSRFATYVPAVM